MPFFKMKSYEITLFLAPVRIEPFLPSALPGTLLSIPLLRRQKTMKECMLWPWTDPGLHPSSADY